MATTPTRLSKQARREQLLDTAVATCAPGAPTP